jgi:protein-tyrosine phosphatase
VRSSGGELAGAWNFRDVAEETGIRPGRFFRSSELSNLSDGGRAAMSDLGITDVADLRSLRELERRGPGLVPDGVDVHLLPFHELSSSQSSEGEAPHESAFEKMMTEKPDDDGVAVAAARFMTEEYLRFPTLPGAHLAVRQVISLLAEGRPVITHCFAGKDRTGFTVALVLDTLGVERSAVVSDFLRSNDAVPQLRDRILESIQHRTSERPTDEIVTFAEARLNEEVLGVREEYLDAAWRTIDSEYGSRANYLQALGVTSDDVAQLRSNLLV